MFSTLCTKLWILKDNLKQDARGVSALEYAILIAVIAGIIVAVLYSENSGLKSMLEGLFEDAKEAIDGRGGEAEAEGN